MSDHAAAKDAIRDGLFRRGLEAQVVACRAATSVDAAAARAGGGVHAVGIGPKVSGGRETGELAVRMYVVQKLPLALIAPRDRLPSTIDGVVTDVIESEPAFAQPFRNFYPLPEAAEAQASGAVDPRAAVRPIRGGLSGGHGNVTAGTIGCVCRSRRVGDDPAATYVLSNNHVFADLNRGLIGDPLFQPARGDGGDQSIASLHRYVILRMGGTIPNRVDAAIGKLQPHVLHAAAVGSLATVSAVASAMRDLPVRKFGRTTGQTLGRIDDADYDALIGMDPNDRGLVALFEGQLRIVPDGPGPVGLGGDSGSVVLHRDRPEVVGLYFAGPPTGSYGLANRIEHVLTELEIEIS